MKFQQMPYEAIIDGYFTAGKRLFISGITPEINCKKFSVTLLTVAKEIAFRFNARFNEKVEFFCVWNAFYDKIFLL